MIMQIFPIINKNKGYVTIVIPRYVDDVTGELITSWNSFQLTYTVFKDKEPWWEEGASEPVQMNYFYSLS